MGHIRGPCRRPAAQWAHGPLDRTPPGRHRHRRPRRAGHVLGGRPRAARVRHPRPPGGFADWPAFLAAQGVPPERWNDASALESEGQPRILFQRVPEPKTGKNRVHVDLLAGGGPSVPLELQRERVAAEVARLEALGATRVDEHADLGVHWVTMRDPEGNEFCV
nr:VOC family protein [Phycicoccus sp. HDW14]